MVQKKQEVFVEMTEDQIQDSLAKLQEDAKPEWGTMTAQTMIEHLEYSYRIASGEIQDFEVVTPEAYLEKVHASLYNYRKFPKGSEFHLAERAKINEPKHENLETAKAKMLEARATTLQFFKDNPGVRNKHGVFGPSNSYEWYLMERKHLNHHFSQFNLL
jgi:oxepin-CoA hydrolase/3-oxo-5,6-dehydrosuberyl-CoA semialdehyde dehydrogenase